MSRSDEAGFTLIETLIALVILATSGVALLGATEAHIARIGALETRAAAQWAAENYLAETKLGTVASERPDAMLGMSFIISDQRRETGDPDLQRIDITVTNATDENTYAALIGFIDLEASQRMRP